MPRSKHCDHASVQTAAIPALVVQLDALGDLLSLDDAIGSYVLVHSKPPPEECDIVIMRHCRQRPYLRSSYSWTRLADSSSWTTPLAHTFWGDNPWALPMGMTYEWGNFSRAQGISRLSRWPVLRHHPVAQTVPIVTLESPS